MTRSTAGSRVVEGAAPIYEAAAPGLVRSAAAVVDPSHAPALVAAVVARALRRGRVDAGAWERDVERAARREVRSGASVAAGSANPYAPLTADVPPPVPFDDVWAMVARRPMWPRAVGVAAAVALLAVGVVVATRPTPPPVPPPGALWLPEKESLAGLSLAWLERAAPGETLRPPLAYRRVPLVRDDEYVMADWVPAPSALALHDDPELPVAGGRARGRGSPAGSRVAWSGADLSGSLWSPDLRVEELLAVAARSLAEGRFVAPAGFRALPPRDTDSSRLLVEYVAERGRVSMRILDADISEFAPLEDQGDSTFLLSLAPGTTVRVDHLGVSDGTARRLAESMRPVSEAEWMAAAERIGVDGAPRRYVVYGRGVASTGAGWAVYAGERPGCLTLAVLESGSSGPLCSVGGVAFVSPLSIRVVPRGTLAAAFLVRTGEVEATIVPAGDVAVAIAEVDLGDGPIPAVVLS